MQIKCKSSGCLFNNKSGNCEASHITMAGKFAMTTNATQCQTYQERVTNGRVHSRAYHTEASEELTGDNRQWIQCNANLCMFNEDYACKATSVLINAKDASCETFKP